MIEESIIEKAKRAKAIIDENQRIADIIQSAGGLKTNKTQSDKLGFDWEFIYVNDILVGKNYTKQDIPVGVMENPFVWEHNIPMIKNAYYIKDGVRKVWTGLNSGSANWNDQNFIEF